ncbi:protein of unknown function [Methylorubrum extorquens]|uniref:Uncharacterized protein n=1 Tax=Methylorubrum extorquens TaxID=408 RepID=A0A2N9AJX5_METEX|nr:protein of unknown function [Methylorubrum extorquens]
MAPHGSLSLRRGSHQTPTADGQRVGTAPPLFSADPLFYASLTPERAPAIVVDSLSITQRWVMRAPPSC